MKAFISLFLIVALYTPAMWFISENNGSRNTWTVGIISMLLIIAPLFVLHYLPTLKDED